MANYLVVGSTSGIGAQITRLALEEGNTVYSINRTLCKEATYAFLADVTVDPLPVIDVPIHGIVYCPGSINLRPFRALKPDDLIQEYHINALGAVRVLQNYFTNMQKADTASVVLFSSVAVQTGMQYHASIAMAKGAVEGLSRSLAAEWAPKVRVNCIAPSLTDTRLANRLLDVDNKREAAMLRHPMKKIGSADQIASTALHLLSEKTGFVTGQVWHIDGGLSIIR